MTALARHFFPSIDLEKLSDVEFAQIVNDAVWLKDTLNPFGSISPEDSK